MAPSLLVSPLVTKKHIHLTSSGDGTKKWACMYICVHSDAHRHASCRTLIHKTKKRMRVRAGRTNLSVRLLQLVYIGASASRRSLCGGLACLQSPMGQYSSLWTTYVPWNPHYPLLTRRGSPHSSCLHLPRRTRRARVGDAGTGFAALYCGGTRPDFTIFWTGWSKKIRN